MGEVVDEVVGRRRGEGEDEEEADRKHQAPGRGVGMPTAHQPTSPPATDKSPILYNTPKSPIYPTRTSLASASRLAVSFTICAYMRRTGGLARLDSRGGRRFQAGQHALTCACRSAMVLAALSAAALHSLRCAAYASFTCGSSGTRTVVSAK